MIAKKGKITHMNVRDSWRIHSDPGTVDRYPGPMRQSALTNSSGGRHWYCYSAGGRRPGHAPSASAANGVSSSGIIA